MEETIFFQSGDVTVTQSRYVVGDKTFAMRNISSVQVGIIAAKRGFGILIIIIGIVLLMSDNTRNGGILLIAIGALFAYLPKDKFTVRISTNAGETDSLFSKDRESIQRIVDALNDAMIHRG